MKQSSAVLAMQRFSTFARGECPERGKADQSRLMLLICGNFRIPFLGFRLGFRASCSCFRYVLKSPGSWGLWYATCVRSFGSRWPGLDDSNVEIPTEQGLEWPASCSGTAFTWRSEVEAEFTLLTLLHLKAE